MWLTMNVPSRLAPGANALLILADQSALSAAIIVAPLYEIDIALDTLKKTRVNEDQRSKNMRVFLWLIT